jgi:hypothetical protein
MANKFGSLSLVTNYESLAPLPKGESVASNSIEDIKFVFTTGERRSSDQILNLVDVIEHCIPKVKAVRNNILAQPKIADRSCGLHTILCQSDSIEICFNRVNTSGKV